MLLQRKVMANPVNPSPTENLAKMVSDYSEDIEKQVMANPTEGSEIEDLAKLVSDFHGDVMEKVRELAEGIKERWPAYGITESDVIAMERATKKSWETNEKLVKFRNARIELYYKQKAERGDAASTTS